MVDQTVKERLLTYLFPHRCFLCGEVLAGTGWICDSCNLPLTREQELCVRCGKRLRECVCAELLPAFERAVAPLYYNRQVRAGIARFKYRGRTYYADFLAKLMHGRLGESNACAEWISYVPMHADKLRERGCCPAKILADALSRETGIPLREDLLRHTGNREAQMKQKGFEARLENAQRSFVRAPGTSSLSGARVILVDDVLTTGSTAHVCAQLLKDCGAGTVWVTAAATTEAEKR